MSKTLPMSSTSTAKYQYIKINYRLWVHHVGHMGERNHRVCYCGSGDGGLRESDAAGHIHDVSHSGIINWKKCSEKQTLRAGCSKVEPKNFHHATDPLPGGAGQSKLISWRWSLPLPTNPVWWGSMQAILSYHGNRPTDTHKHKPTDRTDYITLHHS